jgi:transcriptional regulator with XRE-family HTH domain
VSRPIQDRPCERLQLLRKRLGKSQEELAKLLQLSTKTYQRYERGERPLPGPVVDRAQDELGVNPDWLWDGKGEMFSAPKRMVSGRAFLLGAHGRPGDTMEGDTPSKLRREMDAAVIVDEALTKAGFQKANDIGMELMLALRILVESHAIAPSVLENLARAIKAESTRVSAQAPSIASSKTGTAPLDDHVLTACIAAIEEHPRGRRLPPQKKAKAVLALATLMTHEPAPSKAELSQAIERAA